MKAGFGRYCPVAKAAEILGERWTLLIVRDFIEGAHRFTDLHRGLPGISRSLLTERLRALELEGIVERRLSGGRPEYWLTPRGEDLQPAILALGEWAVRNYSHAPARDERDPRVLMLWIQRHVQLDLLPRERFVVRFEFRDARPSRAWLLIEDRTASVCDDDPGLDPALIVATDVRTLHLVFAGRLALKAALRDGSMQIDGAASHVRAFHRWFGYGFFAEMTRAVVARSA